MFPAAFVYAPTFDGLPTVWSERCGGFHPCGIAPVARSSSNGFSAGPSWQIITRPAIVAHHLVIKIDDAALKINDHNRLQSVGEYLEQAGASQSRDARIQ